MEKDKGARGGLPADDQRQRDSATSYQTQERSEAHVTIAVIREQAISIMVGGGAQPAASAEAQLVEKTLQQSSIKVQIGESAAVLTRQVHREQHGLSTTMTSFTRPLSCRGKGSHHAHTAESDVAYRESGLQHRYQTPATNDCPEHKLHSLPQTIKPCSSSCISCAPSAPRKLLQPKIVARYSC